MGGGNIAKKPRSLPSVSQYIGWQSITVSAHEGRIDYNYHQTRQVSVQSSRVAKPTTTLCHSIWMTLSKVYGECRPMLQPKTLVHCITF
jgi:hypothetical protein